MVKTHVQLDEKQLARLRRLAAERGVSIDSLIRDAVDQHLGAAIGDSERDRAIANIGGFHSGHGNVSDDHDRYLAFAFDSDFVTEGFDTLP